MNANDRYNLTNSINLAANRHTYYMATSYGNIRYSMGSRNDCIVDLG